MRPNERTSELSPARTAALSVLVNADRIRSSIKRMFHNRLAECLAELLQNCQRAQATHVEITTSADSFTIQDNGHGLLSGIDGFHTLLKLAESNFDNETINDQDPMGLGIVSLLTHDQISQVTFTSGTLELTIDTKRWWSDPDYYKTWFERLADLDTPVAGLRITAQCQPLLASSIESTLKPHDYYTYYAFDDIFKNASPAQGYQGILEITLNGLPVRTSLPLWTRPQDVLIKTIYQDSQITIGYNHARSRSSILWYGQLIQMPGLGSFDFHLEVTEGRPVNPLSPSRAGIIQDNAYHQFLAFVREQIFTFLFDLKNRSQVKPAHILACYQLDKSRTTADCPYIVTEEIVLNPDPSSLEELSQSDDPERPPTTLLFTYDERPLLLNEEITILKSTGSEPDIQFGLCTFIPQLGIAYTVRHADYSRMSIGQLWWKPEGNPQHDFFYQPGSYGISYVANTPPPEWLPVTRTPVFAFNESSNYDAAEVDFTVGTTAPMDFLLNQVWAGFSPNEDSDSEPQEDSYRESVEDLIRKLIGKCVPTNYTVRDLQRFLSDPEHDLITSVSYHYHEGGISNPEGKFVSAKKIYNANKRANTKLINPSVAEITVHVASGEKVRLKLY